MKNGHGFTLIELLAAVTIMGILLTIGVIGLSNSQLDARDNERLTDIENIARSLETYYISNRGSYPPTTSVNTIDLATDALPGTSADNFRAPGVTSGMSFIMAQNTSSTVHEVAPRPKSNEYVYQPINNNGGLCTTRTATVECRTYNIFYLRESDNAIVKHVGKYR